MSEEFDTYLEDVFSEVSWKEKWPGRIALGISERFSLYSFATWDGEIVLLDSELRDLYEALKKIFEPKGEGA